MVSVDIGDHANVQPGNDLTAQWRDEECTLKVTKINGNTALADGRECEFLDKLKKGDKVELSAFQHTGKYMETAPVSEPEKGRKKTTWETEDDINGFSAQIAYNLANSITVNSATSSGSGSVALGARYSTLSSYGFGFSVDLAYEFPRTLGTNSTLSFLSIEPNAVFRNDKLYGFAGVNVPIITSQSNWSSTPMGALGFQFGIGYFITRKIGAELNYSFKNFAFAGSNNGLNGFGLRLGYYF